MSSLKDTFDQINASLMNKSIYFFQIIKKSYWTVVLFYGNKIGKNNCDAQSAIR